MASQNIVLKPVVREDVTRLREWLTHEEVSESWFGRYSYGDPAHLGYHPDEMATASDHDWQHVFNDAEHRILSVYTGDGEHIGEVHLAVEESLGDGQLSILIGRSDLWHRGYGTAALHAALETAFKEYGLFRVWVISRSTTKPLSPCSAGSASSTRAPCARAAPHEGSRFDSVVMGMLSAEYKQRTAGSS